MRDYKKKRDEALESRSATSFLIFLKEYQDEFDEGFLDDFYEGVEEFGGDFITYTMAKLAKRNDSVSLDTKIWYEEWVNNWIKEN